MIPYHHPVSSSRIIIPYHHPVTSSRIIISYHYPVSSSSPSSNHRLNHRIESQQAVENHLSVSQSSRQAGKHQSMLSQLKPQAYSNRNKKYIDLSIVQVTVNRIYLYSSKHSAADHVTLHRLDQYLSTNTTSTLLRHYLHTTSTWNSWSSKKAYLQFSYFVLQFFC